MADDLPLSISWKSVADFFSCPVCMCNMQNTHMTPCGHRYCEKCIRECIDRHHKCPCCNQNIRQTELLKDLQFDELVAVAVKEKDDSEKQYFDNLIDNAGHEDGAAVSQDPMRKILSPVEVVLKNHLKNSLASHERYYQELKTEFMHKKEQMQREYTHMKEELHSKSLSPMEMTPRMEQIQSEHEEQMQTLDEDIARCGKMVAEAFDKYLSEHIPSLSILPVTITISLLNKSVQIPDILVKPHDSLEDIQRKLKSSMEDNGDRILEFGPDVRFLCFGPLAKRSLYEMHRMARDVVELGAMHPDITTLPPKCRPILQYNMKPGSDITVYGQVKCESDLPKVCFASTFEKDKGLMMDYFTCNDCRFNWVCRSCMEVCHKDHEVAPYIMNHQPSWACCYCPKKKKCRIN